MTQSHLLFAAASTAYGNQLKREQRCLSEKAAERLTCKFPQTAGTRCYTAPPSCRFALNHCLAKVQYHPSIIE
jgi:hypothetical protein